MGVDVMRWMFCRHDPAENIHFGYKEGVAIEKSVFNTWRNVYAFFCNYAQLDGYEGNEALVPYERRSDLDRWILSELHLFLRNATERLAAYDQASVVKDAERLIDRLSNWYVRRSRRRFWRAHNAADTDKLAAYQTLHEVLAALCKSMAPIVPFMTEAMYRNLVCSHDSQAALSVHLCAYPQSDSALIDQQLSEAVDESLKLVSSVLSLRQTRGLRVRQPLDELRVASESEQRLEAFRRFEEHILDEVNVKRLVLIRGTTVELPADTDRYAPAMGTTWSLALDTCVTPELAAEGAVRDFVRHVQSIRKENSLEMTDRIEIRYETSSDFLHEAVVAWRGYIEAETLAVAVTRVPGLAEGAELKVGAAKIRLAVRKANVYA